jgi:hypothetical protein
MIFYDKTTITLYDSGFYPHPESLIGALQQKEP